MRRIIAEDPDWNLETVAPLVDVCITHIVHNFHGKLKHTIGTIILLDNISFRERHG